jgi:hypothetical protein
MDHANPNPPDRQPSEPSPEDLYAGVRDIEGGVFDCMVTMMTAVKEGHCQEVKVVMQDGQPHVLVIMPPNALTGKSIGFRYYVPNHGSNFMECFKVAADQMHIELVKSHKQGAWFQEYIDKRSHLHALREGANKRRERARGGLILPGSGN